MKCLVGRVIFPTQHHQPHHHSSPMIDRLTMLSQREQLMEDIDCIIEGRFSEVFPHTEDYEELRDELIETLCDAVCKNFPAE